MPVEKQGEALWDAVDEYLTGALLPADAQLDAVMAANHAANLPAIDVTPLQGAFLDLLVRVTQAKRILEIGTLGGYSTIVMARALPAGGRIVTLEYEPRHAEVARRNFAATGVNDCIDVRLGRAIDSLPVLASEGVGPFDLIFIDADKRSNPAYLEWAIRLSRTGTLIVVDNVVREGEIVEAKSSDEDVQGTRRCLERMGSNPRLRATALQTVGSKGYDGFAMAVVL